MVNNQISETINRWVGIFGTINIIAILGGLLYVYFLLPKQALDIAYTQLEDKYKIRQNELSYLNGQITEKTNAINKQLKVAEEGAKRLGERLKAFKEDDNSEAAQLLSDLKDDKAKRVASFLQGAAKLEASILTLQEAMAANQWKTIQKKSSFDANCDYRVTITQKGHDNDTLTFTPIAIKQHRLELLNLGMQGFYVNSDDLTRTASKVTSHSHMSGIGVSVKERCFNFKPQ